MGIGQEQAKVEEKKEEKTEEKKEEEEKPPLPFVLFVDLHCVGCAKKIEKSLFNIRGLPSLHSYNYISIYQFFFYILGTSHIKLLVIVQVFKLEYILFVYEKLIISFNN